MVLKASVSFEKKTSAGARHEWRGVALWKLMNSVFQSEFIAEEVSVLF
jgi:hypothetical protein